MSSTFHSLSKSTVAYGTVMFKITLETPVITAQCISATKWSGLNCYEAGIIAVLPMSVTHNPSEY